MRRAKPAGPERSPGRLRLGLRRTASLVFGVLDLLDLLVFVAIVALVVVAVLTQTWQSPTVRPWLIGVVVAAPILLILRSRGP